MKKLLVLMLVLGMASMANAAIVNLSLTTSDAYTGVAPGTVITVSVVADVGPIRAISDMDLTASGTNTLAIGSGGWTAPGLAGQTDGTETGGDIMNALLVSGTDTNAGNSLYDFSATINANGTISLAVSGVRDESAFPPGDYTMGTLTGLDVTIPEPMTIALLGLGGLFLRRRK